MLASAPKEEQKPPKHKVYVLTAAAPPPSIIFKKMKNLGFEVMHVMDLQRLMDIFYSVLGIKNGMI